jgi:transposase
MAFEAGRDGFWLARWLSAHGIKVHASSVAVCRGSTCARLDTELLKRAILSWLHGERDHCKMVAIRTITDEDANVPAVASEQTGTGLFAPKRRRRSCPHLSRRCPES